MNGCPDCERMIAAILRALSDSETGKGWGPDITVAAYLRDALPPSLREP